MFYSDRMLGGGGCINGQSWIASAHKLGKGFCVSVSVEFRRLLVNQKRGFIYAVGFGSRLVINL